MKRRSSIRLLLLAAVLAGLACATVTSAIVGTPTPPPTLTPSLTPSLTVTFTPSASPLPSLTPTRTPFPTLTAAPTFTRSASVATPDAETVARHGKVFQDLWNTVNDNYVYTDFRGNDWNAIGDRYRALVEAGQTDAEFYDSMREMIFELGDEHSNFQSPDEVQELDREASGANNYVGIGIVPAGHPDKGYVSIVVTFRDSPARQAGLKPHDRILAVNGLALMSADGFLHTENIRGEPGTSLTLTVQTPGEAQRDVTLTRETITGSLPIDYWLVPGTHIAYILVPDLLDITIPDQVLQALLDLSKDAPLEGIILDNRENSGGSTYAGEEFLGLFTKGNVGRFYGRTTSRNIHIRPNDVAGSQTLPLVVLVGPDTVSYGEISAGVLKDQGRATIVGETTLGNVEVSWQFDFEDGSRAWIAMERIDPAKSHTNWEVTGIVPDVMAPAEWDEVSGADDPGVQAAVGVLQGTQ